MGSSVSIFNVFLKNIARSIIFDGIKAQISGDKKNVVSVPYITIFGFLAYN